MPLLHKIAGVAVVCAVILGLMLPGERPGREEDGRAAAGGSPAPGAVEAGTASPAPGSGSPSAPASAPIPAAAPGAVEVKANELGQIPVLMYHRIVKKPARAFDRPTGEFYDELTRLAKSGYQPITAAEFVSGRFDVPAGKHPVVLTFDGSSPDQFALDANGDPRPDTAVAIMQLVARENPGFRPTATFFLVKDIFGWDDAQASAGLKWLLRHGYDVGNHTESHPNLSGLPEKKVRGEIGAMEDRVVRLAGAHTATLAHRFGAVPRKEKWAREQEGRYSFQGIFLAGRRPSPSPFDEEFDRWNIPRVRSEGKVKENDCTRSCSAAWLEHLDKNPHERYTSDGDPDTVTFPKADEDRLAEEYRGRARTY
ncbi:MAG: polysaccharide deacetylase family protein [Actinomadura sp.]